MSTLGVLLVSPPERAFIIDTDKDPSSPFDNQSWFEAEFD